MGLAIIRRSFCYFHSLNKRFEAFLILPKKSLPREKAITLAFQHYASVISQSVPLISTLSEQLVFFPFIRYL